MYENIQDALRRGAAAEALTAARAAVAEQPQDADAQRLLAAAQRMSGDSSAALATIDSALALSPDDAGLHLERANLLMGDPAQLDEVQASLARTLGLDPNQFPAYILQGQLALGRGDLEEANRLARTASRLAPNHPQIAGIDGMVALYRGQHDVALKILTDAAQRAPGDVSLRPALGFAYLMNGHFAFAEQTFRSLLDRNPDSLPLRTLVADLMRRQGRPGEAADSLATLVRSEEATPGLRRTYARLEIEAGRPERALPPLLAAFERDPDDLPTLEGLVDAWRYGNDIDGARTALESALAQRPTSNALWRARLLFEPFAGDGATDVVERWLKAMPDHIPALEARATIHDQKGETELADAIAYQVAALDPGRSSAELRIVDILLRRDPKEAVVHVEGMLAKTNDISLRRATRQLLGRCQDLAGDPVAAVATWVELQAEVVAERLPLPPLSVPPTDVELPPLADVPEGTPGVLLLWGPPGSRVEAIAATLSAGGAPLFVDRTSAQPPRDPLQRYGTAQELRDGTLDGGFMVSQWRAALPARGNTGGPVFDWLLWWDNALLQALRPHLPEALLMVGLRDPRDMLLDWLAWGAATPFALESPLAGATWMAQMLGQIADLYEGKQLQNALIPLDDIERNPQALAQMVNTTLGLELPPAPANAFGTQRFGAGHWRTFAQPLAEAFALLTPVAVRLGYPEN
ncbi:tetratricopeptide repeat protein [Lysobacter fragariae]